MNKKELLKRLEKFVLDEVGGFVSDMKDGIKEVEDEAISLGHEEADGCVACHIQREGGAVNERVKHSCNQTPDRIEPLDVDRLDELVRENPERTDELWDVFAVSKINEMAEKFNKLREIIKHINDE